MRFVFIICIAGTLLHKYLIYNLKIILVACHCIVSDNPNRGESKFKAWFKELLPESGNAKHQAGDVTTTQNGNMKQETVYSWASPLHSSSSMAVTFPSRYDAPLGSL